ncbi:hypothetical protein HYPSUDRAFT_163027 [Hypholoma sublateritium FD-334 SS-4]|uniref:Cytochrome P450 n=1 Tax=Hypholoma sublateritium (strain FD-334 SS-4) TaxID=945553 RepID=A0A0D2P515_HYPSF|nr:hypothetical protein HYPSUDRAFT_163027 [Hypholoma sublateritium FD-334 SS-4]
MRRRSDDVPSLQGPKSSSWIYGNMIEFILGVPCGEAELGWFAKYGDVVKIHGCFGQERLIIADPGAIRHIFQDPEVFVKSRKFQLITLIGFGQGSLLSANGDSHRRIRSVMNTMFSAPRVRALKPTLERIAKDFSDELASMSGSIVDAHHLLHKTSLRAVTEAVIGYDAVADKKYTATYQDLLGSASHRSRRGVVADTIISWIPDSWIWILMEYPPPELRKLMDHRKMTYSISEKLITSRLESLKSGEPAENDLYSVLVRTNAKATYKMTDTELKEQFGGITTAGEDTTGNSMVWILYVLSQHPEWQARLREEIREADHAASDAGVDYDRLPFLNAIIKEVLRFHPAGSFTEREAACDTVIPLATPLVTSTGTRVSEIKMRKGTKMGISMFGYNRLRSIWGDDAEELNPFRWLDGREIASGGTIGPYANLLNFIGGPRTCLGWRFSILEIQVIVSELMRNFVLSFPEGVSIRPVSAITVVPMDDEGRTWLPLHVERL